MSSPDVSQEAPKLRTNFLAAAPFGMSLLFVPITLLALWLGGWWVLLLPLYGWYIMPLLDAFSGMNEENPDVNQPDDTLFWYRLITLMWVPVQATMLFASLAWVLHSGRFTTFEAIAMMAAVGTFTGGIGINYAHEMMHQKPRYERFLGDCLMTMTLYGHFRSEHLLVHHRYVGTPRDPVTAPYNVGAHRVIPRVLVESLVSAWNAEKAMLARRQLAWWHRRNPFWLYGALQLFWLAVAFGIGGWFGVALFVIQAIVAVLQLELVNYIEHYGLTRRHLGNGKYEHVKPHHSWNAAHRMTNYLLINLQRHSDHHYKPDRRFPVLQTYSEEEAPQLPFGYPLMIIIATIPPLWRRIMNPKVREWRQRYYPDIEDWHDYNHRLNPLPR